MRSSNLGLLKRIGGQAFARLTQYDYDRFNAVVARSRAALRRSPQRLELDGSRWLVTTRTSRVNGAALDCEVTFRCEAGRLRGASVAVDLDFDGWSLENYVLLPGAAYAGNRFLSRQIPYSPKLHFARDIGPDRPPVITDVPRLNVDDGPSRIQERSGALATPALGFRSARHGLGFWLLTRQGNALGDHGLGVEELRGRGRAVLTITSPVVREQHAYRICDAHAPSPDRPHDFARGDAVTIAFRVDVFPAPDVQALFDRFAVLRKGFTAAAASGHALPFSACFALQERKFNCENFVARHGYYAVGPRTSFLQDWQIGWTGGMISTYPLLFAGDTRTRRRVLRNFDWLFRGGISPSGFFWDSGEHGTRWYGGDIRNAHTANWHLVRKSGDGAYYVLKQLELMRKLGIRVKPEWEKGTRAVCDAFDRLWAHAGQLGQFVDSLTGEVRVGGSTSGAIVPAALVLAARWFGEPRYLELASEIAGTYFRDHTSRGLTCGGPGDACQNPDSESAYALVESYMALFDATGEPCWRERAAQAARQLATWVVSYDFAFPAGCTFARAGIRTTGAVYANAQNKHAAPGLCTYSGLALLKLFRATGERFFLDLLRDIARNIPQYLPHPCRPLGRAPAGHVCERVNMTDWEGTERIGESLHLSTWAETSLMLTAVEIPGLYVRLDAGLAVAFDNIEAAVVDASRDRLVVRVSNPTPLPADVRVLAEAAAEAGRPLGEARLLGCPTVALAPGETRDVAIGRS